MARLVVGHHAGGGAGLGHRPGLDQRKAEALLRTARGSCGRRRRRSPSASRGRGPAPTAAPPAASPASRPGSAAMVAPLLARAAPASCRGWKRSSCTRQPPATRTTIVENAIALHVFSGSGVMSRSPSRPHRAHAVRAPRTSRRRAGSRRWRACSPWAGRWCRRCRASAHSLSAPGGRAGLRRRGLARGRRAAVETQRRRMQGAAPSLLAGCRQVVDAAAGSVTARHDLAVADQVVQFGRRAARH